MAGYSVKTESVLNITIRGLNALIGVYLATVISESVIAYFAYVGSLNLFRGLDFGYSFYQRHKNMQGRQLALGYSLTYIVMPIVLFYWLLPRGGNAENLLVFLLSAGLYKWIGTHAHLHNLTWTIPIPIFATNLFFVANIGVNYSFLFCFVCLVLVLYIVSYRKSKQIRYDRYVDSRLLRDAINVFIPSFLYLALSEYVFVYMSEDLLVSSKLISIYLKLNAVLVSIIFLFNDIYWNRYGEKQWSIFSRYETISVVSVFVLLAIFSGNILAVLGVTILSSFISGYLVRQRLTRTLLYGGCLEALIYFTGLYMYGLDYFFEILGCALGLKLLVIYYGSGIFSRKKL